MAGWVSERATRSARRLLLVALLGVLAVGVWGAFAVFAASPGPKVSSFTLNGTSPTNASSVSWKVVFSSAVTGVAGSNFTPVAGGAVTVSGLSTVTPVNSSTYTVTVNTTATSGSGTLGLNLSSAGSIKDSSNHALQGVPYTGLIYTVDKTAPTATVTFPANGGLYNAAVYASAWPSATPTVPTPSPDRFGSGRTSHGGTLHSNTATILVTPQRR